MSDYIKLDTDSASIQYLCKKDKRLAKVIDMVGPISYTLHDDNPYEFLVHEIIEQMLSVKAGAKIFERLTEICNNDLSPQVIANCSREQLLSTGTSNNKATYIQSLTSAVVSGSLDLTLLPNYSDDVVIEKLTSIKGIGNWTAKMYLIFVLDRQDVLPVEDGAFLQVYKWLYKTQDISPKSIEKRCRKWKPYSSIASRYFYRALDCGLLKQEFHLYK